ncbi:putative ABC transport system permease protein [Pontibacter ummariensis]|uniref:Putative ABC transport system permease protein n=1 Tax=Pontibacter ummariensis TaxID=1610492 RepID=A0A239K8N3_9BACT|nr:ABC transporter permease [Pontibacter ummariensis]PRY06067.1 putative ABC transport system permease protein [Pontibacter ummariensis]SNT14826.1 putative ABC transport system permease protein [Pontibacter ummariensis]
MFDLDKWQEILGTMQKNKLRTFLTAFGVFWGIFMLVLLLGAGKGMENGVYNRFGAGAKNSIFVWSGKTALAHKGMVPGREIKFTNEDLEAIEREVAQLNKLAPRNRVWGEYTINYKDQNGSYQVFGAEPAFLDMNGERPYRGRVLNEFDEREKRKVIVLGEQAAKVLFKEQDPVGEYVNIQGIYFKVIGTFKASGNNSGRREERAYIPFSTLQTAFSQPNQVQMMLLTPQDGVPAKQVEDKLRALLAKRHKFAENDDMALGIENTEAEYLKLQGLFSGISIFVWIVGIGTLIAGIVGVSNIMLIIVKERTREIGVRKALGATPFSIVSLILQESVVITAFSGYMGLLCGTGLLALVEHLLVSSGAELPFFANPEVDLEVALAATLVLVLSGALAGLVPALKAANIKPIEALRAD